MHLCTIVENSNLSGESQNGFRPKRWGTDNLFILKTIHEITYLNSNKCELYLAYIDLTKAYDCVHLPFVWYK